MKSRLFSRARTLIATGLLVVSGSSISQPIENPGTFNPVNLSTLPPSSYQSGPIRNPVRIDINGNLVITGNVRRGMHFRDTVPYDSTTSFRADLGSSSLNSFLRDSAGTEDLGRSVSKYRVQPYYLQSRTVTTSRPGYSGVFKHGETNLNNRRLQGGFTTGTYISDSEKQTSSGSDIYTTVPLSQGLRTQYKESANPPTIVKSIRELQLLTQQNENITIKEQQSMIEKYRKQNQELQDNIKRPQDSKKEAGISFEPLYVEPESVHNQQNVIEKYKFTEPLDPGQSIKSKQTTTPDISNTIKYPVESIPESNLTPAEKYSQKNAMVFKDGIISSERDISIKDQGNVPSHDIVEQVKKQLEDLSKTINEKENQEAGLKSKDIITNIGLSSDAFKWGDSSFKSTEDRLNELKKLSPNNLSAETREIKALYTNTDNFSMRRFEHHFQEGQNHLKRGRYYVAVDSFAAASIYKPNDPLCLAGRGHALLAAGEYISSALFLSRAIETDAGYIKTKINLSVMMGGQHILDKRIADIKEWQARSGSGKLDFLLGYTYYRMGRLGPARKAINSAYVKLPQSKAIALVKKAVDDALEGK
jgi:tetratricopeptide (TPR) repeat protein